MSGSYDPLNPPKRAGFYSRIVAAAEIVATGGSGGIVATPIVTDWGPAGITRVTNQREFEAEYGTADDEGHFGVVGALTGTGETDNGASEVLVQRVIPSAAAYAERDFNNTTPAAAVNIRAKYKGTRGNSITVTFRDHPSEAGVDQLLVYLSGDLIETYNYAQTDIAALVADVNANSDLLFLTQLVTGVAMAAVTAQALTDTAGANGTAVAGDYTAAFAALETENLNILIIPGMTDSTILAAARTWISTMNSTMRRIVLVTGGADAETFGAATTRSALSPTNENIVNLGYNMFTDPSGTARNTAEIAGYVAGMIAAAGPKRSITFARLPEGFELTVAPTYDEIISALEGGLVVMTKDALGIRIEKGITTFTDANDADKPLDVMSRIQQVRTIHQIENDLTEATEGEWIGKVQNTDKSREAYVGMLLAYFRRLEGENILKPGSSVRLDETQDNTGDTLYPIYSIEMASAIERVLAIGEVTA